MALKGTVPTHNDSLLLWELILYVKHKLKNTHTAYTHIWEFFEKVSEEFPIENVNETLPLFTMNTFFFFFLSEGVSDCNNKLCEARTFSHKDRETHTVHTKISLPDFHRGWLGTTKSEDKKQLSIQNSQFSYTHARNSPANDWAEHQLDPGNHLVSRKGGKKSTFSR